MKLHENYIIYNMSGECMLVPVGKAAKGFHGMLRANRSAGVVLNCLKEETTLEAIVDVLASRYDASREELTEAAQELLDELRELGALRE